MQLSIHNLIDDATGQTDRSVLRTLVHRRAIADYGALSPRAICSSQRYYGPLLAQMKFAWRQRHGLPIETVELAPFGKQRCGVRRSAF